MPSKARLPVLLSIPHAGLQVPPEVESMCRLRPFQILRDGDTWADYIYSFEDRVYASHSFSVARAVLDVNRDPNDRPPGNPDGVVKTYTTDHELVWKDAEGVPDQLVDLLLNQYYYPYHEYLEIASCNRNILLGLDCHTMLERAPSIKGNRVPGERRPLVCLGNRGDKHGEELDQPVTAPPTLMRSLAKILERRLQEFAGDMEVPVVSLNEPFRGGYITKKHGADGLIPWIQVEFNRSLYLLSGPRRIIPPPEVLWRINRLKDCFCSSLEELFSI